MPQIAKVAVAAATYAIDKPYDYLVPQGADMAVGMRVLVPFGRGNRVSEGVVLTLGQGVPEKPIKPIRSLVDREPVITEREIRLALWMRERYFCTFYDAIRTILPAAVWYSYREMWSLTGEPLPEDLSERETAACRLLQDGPMERDDLCAALGETGSRVLAGLKKRGILQMEPQGTRKVQDKVVQIAALSLAPQEALRQMERKRSPPPGSMTRLPFWPNTATPRCRSFATTPAYPGRASAVWSGRGFCPCAARRSIASPGRTMPQRRRRSA